MDIRTERLKIAYVWLRRNKGLRSQKELADRIGVDQNTISRAMTGKVVASDDVLEKINQSYGSPFNFTWMRGESNQQFVSKEERSEKQISIIELYARLIKEVEGIKRDLSIELEALRFERQQLSALTRQLRHTVGVPYPETENSISIAAEPNTTQL